MVTQLAKFLCLLASLALSVNVAAQTQLQSELKFIVNHNPLQESKKESAGFIMPQTNEIKLLSLSMIRFYQLFISSQHDKKAVCIFTPSCSHFGQSAIEKYGILYGILMTADRVQRCHGFGKKDYPIDPEARKFNDPIEKYYWKKHLK